MGGEADSAVPRVPEPQRTYLLEEQKQRRAEIEKQIERVEGDQRYGLIFTAGIWSWLATSHKPVTDAPFVQIIAFLPALLTVFFGVRWWKLHMTIQDAARYTLQLERLFGLRELPPDPDPFGWEKWLRPGNDEKRVRHTLAEVTFIWWASLFVLNAVLAVLYIVYLPAAGS